VKDLRRAVRSKLEALLGIPSGITDKDVAKLREKIAVLERLDERDRIKIGMENEYQ
jgi:hypothetical protein